MIFDFRLPILDFGLSSLSRQNDNAPFEPVLTKVAIKGKSMVESVMVNQSKASAIDKAEVFVIVSHKNPLGRLFDRFADTKRFDAGLIQTLHEFDGGLVTDSETNQGIALGENKIRC